MSDNHTKKLNDFIAAGPTPFHVVANVGQILDDAGFEHISEADHWTIEPGKKYYVTRNDSSLIAFVPGNISDSCSFKIIASHTDSPCFKLKEEPELKTEGVCMRLNTEGYGGMILNTWLDRPLSIAGRVIVKTDEQTLESRLFDFERDMVLIPNVAVHMNREINDGFKYNKQIDLMPLYSENTQSGLLKSQIAEKLGFQPQQIMGSDLYLYNRQQASVWGAEEEFFSSPRLDDQQCVFASIEALLASEPVDDTIQICACFDNEEVGSGTMQGACSTFLSDTLQRIMSALGKSQEDYRRALATSFMISADNAQAVHPNHPELTDAQNRVYMNKGVVVKSHAGQKYTSDGMSIAMIRMIAEKENVPLQYFSNRSDKVGGSTLGNLSQSQVSVKSVDVGLAQLAMHSAYETAGVKDTEFMIRLMTGFYRM